MGVLKARDGATWYEVGQSGVQGPPGNGGLGLNVKNYGAVGNGVADDTAAVQAAITAAVAAQGGRVEFPAGTYKLTADLNINADNIELSGVGAGTVLAFTNGGIHLNGINALRYGQGISDLYVSRGGTAGPAIRVSGGDQLTTVRWTMSNVHVKQSSGNALTIDGSYIGDLFGCYLNQAFGIGVEIKLDPTIGQVAGNAIKFFGGEIYGNNKAASLDSVANVVFDGVCIEGNGSGMTLRRSCRGVLFSGCYFEGNNDFDVEVGTEGMCSGITFLGCLFFSAPARANSVILNRSWGTFIGGNIWSGYSGPPLRIEEATPGEVVGYEWGNVGDGGPGTVNVVNLVAGVNWQKMDYLKVVGPNTTHGGLTIIAPDADTHLALYGTNNTNLRFNNDAGVVGGMTAVPSGIYEFVPAGKVLDFDAGGTGHLTVSGSGVTLNGALDHDGTTAGFYGAPPVVKPTSVTARAALEALGLGATLTAEGGGGGISTEDAVDAVAAALVAGNNIDVTYDDTANTITVDVEALTKTDVGLGNVDNTADTAKPLFTTTVRGLVPPPTTATGKYLKDDATWATPATGGATAQTIEAVAGATYTVVTADANKIKRLAATATITLPSAGPGLGERVDFVCVGGPATFALGGGATWDVNPTPSAVARAVGSMVTAVKMSATAWALTGDLA